MFFGDIAWNRFYYTRASVEDTFFLSLRFLSLKSFYLCSVPGFAVSLQVILSSPKAVFKRRGSQPGMQESDFLKQITKVEELEPKADNCTKVKPSNATSEFYFFIDNLLVRVYALLHSVCISKITLEQYSKQVQPQIKFFFLWAWYRHLL